MNDNEATARARTSTPTLARVRRFDRSELRREIDRGRMLMLLEEWIGIVQAEGSLATLEVRHERSRVAMLRIDYSGDKETCQPHELVKRIAGAMEADAHELPNVDNRYKLEAFWGEAFQPDSEAGFTCRWDNPDDEGSALEAFTGGGSKANVQATSRALVASFDLIGKLADYKKSELVHSLKDAREEIVRLSAEVNALRSELLAATKAQQLALNEAQDRLHKNERHKELLKGAKELLGMAKMWGPILLNKAAGQQVLPVPEWANPMIEKLNQIYEAVTEDEQVMNGILNALSKSPKALILFGDFMSGIQDRRKVDEARARRVEAMEAAAEETAAAEEEKRIGKQFPATRINRLLYGI